MKKAAIVSCTTLSDVKPETVRWIWPGRIPVGKVVVIEGDPGLGKSTLTATIAAHVSGGPTLPGASPDREPADVLLLTYEDGIADTILPRVLAAGGDAARIHVLSGVRYSSDV